MKKYLDIIKEYVLRKKLDRKRVTIKLLDSKYEDLRIEDIQNRLEEKYFPELKGKVDLIYSPDSIADASTPCNIFSYKPIVKIGPLGLLKLIDASDEVKEGILAHEYSHIVDKNKKGLLGIIKRIYRKMFYLKSNNFEKKLKYEMQTDLEAAKRGCGKQVLETLKEFKKHYESNRERDIFDTDNALKQLNPRIENLETYLNK